jgi:hypothetical protein
LANAAAGAIGGESIEDIAKGAALTFALTYGPQALSKALSETASAAAKAGVQGGAEMSVLTDLANSTADPIAAMNALSGWTGSDMSYLAKVGMPDIVMRAAEAVNLGMNLPTTIDGWNSYNAERGVTTPTSGPVTPGQPVSTGVEQAGPVNPYAQTQQPYNLQSTGITSDAAPNTLLDENFIPTNDPAAGRYVVTNGGKTVPLDQFNEAYASGQPISIDGAMTTGKVTGVPTPSASQQYYNALVDSGYSPDAATNLVRQVNPNFGSIEITGVGVNPELIGTGPLGVVAPGAGVSTAGGIIPIATEIVEGLTAGQIAAMGGAAAATATVAAVLSSGGGAAQVAAAIPPTPVAPATPGTFWKLVSRLLMTTCCCPIRSRMWKQF